MTPMVLCTSVLLFAVAADHPPPSKPKVELTVSPKIAQADIWQGRLITATLTIKNVDETLWCSDVDWEWNEQHSFQSSDCDPFEMSEEGERQLWIQVRQRLHFGRSDVHITVRLIKAGKVLRKVEAVVLIM